MLLRGITSFSLWCLHKLQVYAQNYLMCSKLQVSKSMIFFVANNSCSSLPTLGHASLFCSHNLKRVKKQIVKNKKKYEKYFILLKNRFHSFLLTIFSFINKKENPKFDTG
jgi:hypothetical protein